MITIGNVTTMLSDCKNLFVSGEKDGWKNTFGFACLCLLLGLTITACLLLVVLLSKIGIGMVSLNIAIIFGITISSLAFFFKSVRCMSLLFLLSCGMREGRNALIATGTGIVVFNNVKNVLGNVKILADSIICNLDAKRISLKVMPFDFYIKALHSIYQRAKNTFFNLIPDIVSVSDNFRCNVRLSDAKLKALLNETKQRIEAVSSDISLLLDIITVVSRIVCLLIGIFIILFGTWMFFKKFVGQNNAKFANSYITKTFMEYDAVRKQQNALGVLPLNKKEQNMYIRIPSLKTSRNQKIEMTFFFIPVFTNVFIWSLISFLDFMLYWLIHTMSVNLKSLHPVLVPISVSLTHTKVDLINLGESGKTVSSFHDNLKINLFEPQCTPKPELSLTSTWIPLAILISVLLFLGFISAFLIHVKLLVIGAFYPNKELQRVSHLHKKILEERARLTTTSKSQTVKRMISRVDFWFPIITRKHYATSQ
ncbi:dendritic cell-specific transmembrane protein [Pseudophryne corroboree]|uniref:dendritic cell-specific transmembrane protein n=1 Tax=Pseudophryne corroboree TaxID=495146 RepID=UPI003081F67F